MKTASAIVSATCILTTMTASALNQNSHKSSSATTPQRLRRAKRSRDLSNQQFTDSSTLRAAVEDYVSSDDKENSDSAKDFGYPIGTWDVSQITDFSELFYSSGFNRNWDLVMFNEDISGWDVSSATTMSAMFRESAFNQDISGWDVSSVTDMSEMLYLSYFEQDISGWDVSSVTSMSYMFGSTLYNHSLSDWDVSSVVSMYSMFDNTVFNQDISGWDVSSVVNMGQMFYGSSFNQDISSWNVSSVETMTNMFDNAADFSQNLCPWKDVVNSEYIWASPSFDGTSCPITISRSAWCYACDDA